MSNQDEKLYHAQEWMRREVLAQKNHIWEHTRSENDILETIWKYFPPKIFMSFSESCVKELITSELLFDTLSLHPIIDGSWIILWYQKVFDTLFENWVTKWYRKYVRKYRKPQKPENNPLEKSLYLVIEKWYILSAGRIYEILENIKNKKEVWFYEALFISYLKTSSELEMSLPKGFFLIHLQVLMKKKILWEKRHSWVLSYDDTLLARKIYIWDLRDTNSLLWILANLWSVEG